MIIALFAGIIIGIIFNILKLPVPAPGTIQGILGIIGIFIGYETATYITK